MENLVLIDKNQFPDDDVIFSNIGSAKLQWTKLFEILHEKYPEFTEQWRYYNAAKSWNLRIMKNKKTVMWVSVFKEYFKVVFYFGEKPEQKAMKLNISDKLKDKFINGPKFGKIKGIVIVPISEDDLTDIFEIINLKLKL